MTDEVLRRVRREHEAAPDDIEALRRYTRELERVVGGDRKPPRLDLASTSAPCLLCEKPVEISDGPDGQRRAADIARSNLDRGTDFHAKLFTSHGSYGCQVLDMSGRIHFVLCDGCIIRHSPKMVYVPYEAVRDENGQLVENELGPEGGEVFKHEWRPAMNARDHYDAWWKSLWEGKSEAEKQDDSYYTDVAPYFKD